jgi:hypothetical protein
MGVGAAVVKSCETCVFWRKDYGTFTVTGWTGMDRNDGYCHLEPKVVPKQADDLCQHWEGTRGCDQ